MRNPEEAEEPVPATDEPRSDLPKGFWPFEGLRARLLTPGSFARSVLTLMTGTTLATVIPVAISPILTRLYSPSDFGLFAIYSGVAALLSVPATGRYEMAIVLPAEDDDAFHVLGLSLLVAGLVASVCALAVLVMHSGLLTALHSPGLSRWLYLLPLGIVLTASIQVFSYWLNRKQAYPRIAQSRILQSTTAAVLAIVLAPRNLGAGGLILSSMVGQMLAAVLLSLAAWSGLRGTGQRLGWTRMRQQAVRYKDFPRVNALHALLDNLGTSATAILLSHQFGSVVVGHYSIVMRVLTAPVALIGAAITQVFYRRAAEIHNGGGALTGLMRSLLVRSAWIALPATLLLLIGAPTLFTVIFGPKWAVAGNYARLLSPYMFFYFLAAPLAFVPFVLNKQFQSFLLSATGNLLFLACIAVGGRLGAPEFGFGLLSAVQSLYFAAYIGWMLRIAAVPHGRSA